jgi:membrane protease YdiL (CAAX protease family)
LIVLLASISEEVLFRGFLQNILDNSLLLAIDLGWFSITSGAVISAIVFGVIHVAPAKQQGSSVPIMVISAVLLGLLAGIFLTISGSLILPIIVHIEFNLVGFILGTRK